MDAIRDRIRGALYGLAVGNALGLRVDGLSRTEIERRYPRWFMVFDELDPDGRLIPGSWTSKTEHALRRLDELVATGYDRVDVLDCGDEATTRRPTPNELRTCFSFVLGIFTPNSREHTADNVTNACRNSHDAPRCRTTNVILGEAVRSLTLAGETIHEMLERLLLDAQSIDATHVDAIDFAVHNSVDHLRLNVRSDDPTHQTLKAAIWAIVHGDGFKNGLLCVLREGGNAKLHGGAVGLALGARHGLSRIPKAWIDGLYERSILEARVEAIVEHVVTSRWGCP